MTYKLIATDMDGTILLKDKSLSQATIAAMKEARDKGIEIVICTGRTFSNVLPYLSQINIDCNIITNNGAVIRDKDRRVLYSNYIKTQQMEQLLSILEAEDDRVYYHTADENLTYINSFIKRLRVAKIYIQKRGLPFYRKWLEIIRNVFFSKGHKRIDYREYLAKGGRFTSVFIYSEEPERLVALRKKLVAIAGIEITSSANDNLEVLDIASTKGNALKKLSEMMGISQEETVAIGDHLNDLSMIKFAGLGVAMGNGDEAVLRAADWVTKTNEEDGFSHLVKTITQGDGSSVSPAK